MSISQCSLNLEHSFIIGHQGNIKSSTTKIKHEHILLTFSPLYLVKTISNSSCSRLVDDPHHIKTSDFPCIFCSLSLRVVEVSRNSDNSIFHFMAQISFSIILQLRQHHGRYLLR
ncbi:hypothetical protein KIW84_015189 [Lathyrus oleraceus]|uniref:Uncharacterized protein n=1 Tax=Pisum sativum TaxID=3888 RepID=A0A9D5BPM7_PEA|nr:hypothetical protein KIW84_015189 [Pisum sativum]